MTKPGWKNEKERHKLSGMGISNADKIRQDEIHTAHETYLENEDYGLGRLIKKKILETTPKGKWEYNKFGHLILAWDDGSELYIQDEESVEAFLDTIKQELAGLGWVDEEIYPGDHDKIPDSINWDYYNVSDKGNK